MPEFRPINATTHFKSAFDIEPKGRDPLMVQLRKILRNWAKEKIGVDHAHSQKVFEPWFFNGNNKSRPHAVLNGMQVRTGIVGSHDISSPHAWSLELIHRDFAEPSRRWSVDVAFVQNVDQTTRFTTVVSHWMIPNYIGAYPEPPLFNTPRYIRELVKNFKCRRGSCELSSRFEPVTHDSVQAVYDQLRDPKRRVPFVFVTADPDTQNLVIDPVRLYRFLLGNANVYAFFDQSVLDGMNYFLGTDHRVDPGSVRCFQTDFDKSASYNSRIHRYFTRDEVRNTPDAVLTAIANGFARNSNCFYPRDITHFNDIFTLRRTETIRRLLSQKIDPTAANVEELQMFMDENAALEAKIEELELFSKQCMQEKDDSDAALGRARHQIREAEKLKLSYKNGMQVQRALESFAKLPGTLAEVLAKIGDLFPQRIAISPIAFKTASEHSESCAYWKKAENIPHAWEMCYELATKGFAVFFESDGGDKEKLFRDQSQFELAMTEGKMTKKDKRLMDLRKLEYDGEQFDMSPHIKLGNRPDRLLRLYFAVDAKNKRFIVGHFGSHIDNASTRSLS